MQVAHLDFQEAYYWILGNEMWTEYNIIFNSNIEGQW